MSNKIKINLNEVDKIRRFGQVARRFASDVDIIVDNKEWEAKSIVGLFNLDLSKETFVSINTDDVEEENRFNAAMEEFK